MSTLEQELKHLIVEVLNLEDISADDIGSEEILFGEGLGLDSIDALELGLALQKRYDIKINAESADTRAHFATVANLARFIETQRPHQ